MKARSTVPIAAVFGALTLGGMSAQADPPVKVCVAVAGDADETVRAAAETAVDAIAHHAALRGVADADARAALRGEPNVAADFADLAASRRALRGTDADSAPLDAVSVRLGCGAVLELMARPAGTLARVWDPVRHVWGASREVATVDATLLDAVVIPTLQARVSGSVDAGAVVATLDGGATADASVGDDATAAATGDGGAATNDATAVADATADGGAGDGGVAQARTGANDPRVAPTPAPSTWSRVWPWLAVGGVVVGVVVAYLLAGQDIGPSSTQVTVSHAGTP